MISLAPSGGGVAPMKGRSPLDLGNPRPSRTRRGIKGGKLPIVTNAGNPILASD